MTKKYILIAGFGAQTLVRLFCQAHFLISEISWYKLGITPTNPWTCVSNGQNSGRGVNFTKSQNFEFYCIFMWQFQKSSKIFPILTSLRGGSRVGLRWLREVHTPVPPSGHVCVKWSTYIWSYYMRRRDVPLWCNRSLIFW